MSDRAENLRSPVFLIVDDSPTVRKMIMSALRPLTVDFGEAASGLEALEQLALRHYDMVTLDLNMPDMHGLDFLQFVRRNRMFQNIPILVISTRTDPAIQSSILSAGANAYLTKPFQPDEIVHAAEHLLYA